MDNRVCFVDHAEHSFLKYFSIVVVILSIVRFIARNCVEVFFQSCKITGIKGWG